jgi:hypothetical protein
VATEESPHDCSAVIAIALNRLPGASTMVKVPSCGDSSLPSGALNDI